MMNNAHQGKRKKKLPMGFAVHPNAKFAALMKEAEQRTKDEL